MNAEPTWSIQPGYYEKALDEHFTFKGLPVLVHRAGVYPTLVNDRGECTNNTPHFLINYLSVDTREADGSVHTFYTRVYVVAVHGRAWDGRTMAATSWEKQLDKVNDIAPYIEEAKRHLNAELLYSLPARYEAAMKRIAQGDSYAYALSRESYEAACKTLQVECYTDEQCNGWGDFRYPEYDADKVLAMRLADNRWRGRLSEQARAKTPTPLPSPVPRQSGQLWEPCPHCRQEPIYMPLHVCDDCWPKETP